MTGVNTNKPRIKLINSLYIRNCTSELLLQFHLKVKKEYIKSKRKDNTGIAPLKSGKTIYTSAEQKSRTLNKRFQSVFKTENLSNIYHS